MFSVVVDHDTRVHAPFDTLVGVDRIERVSRVRRVRGERGAADPAERSRDARDLMAAYDGAQAAARAREPALEARQIMSAPVVTLPPDASLAEARALFRERRFRHVPIVSGPHTLVGIVSDRDLLATRGEGPAAVDRPDASDDANGGADTTIRAITKTRVLTASRETAIRQIAFVMIEQRIGAMPIIDESGHLEGIITRSDILRAVVNQAPLELWV